ncbi:hypothetical protein LCGC14_2613530 [marine sediment metagenome]|jgi:hypothetical protein|uniref:Uncharacterized protein n=1 Tax=marine sediment metagenome TaxID=412755 RepID=A0A0F9CGB3_9ZZZZ
MNSPVFSGGKKTVTDTIKYLETLMQETQKPEAELMAQAFQTGVRQMWRERTLGRYLRGQITRQKAVELAGIDWVELAERQHKAMMEDLAWAMEN